MQVDIFMSAGIKLRSRLSSKYIIFIKLTGKISLCIKYLLKEVILQLSELLWIWKSIKSQDFTRFNKLFPMNTYRISYLICLSIYTIALPSWFIA